MAAASRGLRNRFFSDGWHGAIQVSAKSRATSPTLDPWLRNVAFP